MRDCRLVDGRAKGLYHDAFAGPAPVRLFPAVSRLYFAETSNEPGGGPVRRGPWIGGIPRPIAVDANRAGAGHPYVSLGR
jgi:hypothetical protein